MIRNVQPLAHRGGATGQFFGVANAERFHHDRLAIHVPINESDAEPTPGTFDFGMTAAAQRSGKIENCGRGAFHFAQSTSENLRKQNGPFENFLFEFRQMFRAVMRRIIIVETAPNSLHFRRARIQRDFNCFRVQNRFDRVQNRDKFYGRPFKRFVHIGRRISHLHAETFFRVVSHFSNLSDFGNNRCAGCVFAPPEHATDISRPFGFARFLEHFPSFTDLCGGADQVGNCAAGRVVSVFRGLVFAVDDDVKSFAGCHLFDLSPGVFSRGRIHRLHPLNRVCSVCENFVGIGFPFLAFVTNLTQRIEHNGFFFLFGCHRISLSEFERKHETRHAVIFNTDQQRGPAPFIPSAFASGVCSFEHNCFALHQFTRRVFSGLNAVCHRFIPSLRLLRYKEHRCFGG
ncbi:hypothetical protein HUU40_00195 [candidate division KSB1 bacterium]|nr:hypothetical protein [candidate division KSB1 bacterium]